MRGASEADIERIVQEVIRRLMSAGVRINNARGELQIAELEIKDRVITLATLDGQLEGVRQLVVQRNAVVTPSVRDELTDRNIELVRKTS